MKKYNVGIDFGHGETAAWIAPNIKGVEIDSISGDKKYILTSDMKIDGEPLRMAQSNGMDTIWSIIYKEDDKFTLVPQGNNFSPILGFKNKIACLAPGQKEALKNFIYCVVVKLIELNDDKLKRDKGEWNFDLFIACPTGWSEQDTLEYLCFFNETLTHPLGINIKWIIKESDAALFSKLYNKQNNLGCTLVIDYGSSTIDYTAYGDKKISEDEWSKECVGLGASKIERIMDRLEKKDDDQEKKDVDEKIKRIKADYPEFDFDTIWQKECREYKESMFAKEHTRIRISFNLRKYKPELPLDHPYRFDYIFDIDDSQNFKKYREKVKDEFKDIKEKLYGLGKNVDTVVLSGGACIMSWVKESVREIYPQEVNICKDRFPQYFVAQGIALYAQRRNEAKLDLKEAIKKIPFKDIYIEVDKSAMSKTIPLKLEGLKSVILGNSDLSGKEILSKYCNFLRDLISVTNGDYNDYFKEKFKAQFKIRIKEKICKVLKEKFNKDDVDISDKDIVVIGNVRPFKAGAYKEGGLIYNGLKGIIESIVDAFWAFNWEKKRDYDVRKKIYDAIPQKLEDWFLNSRYPYIIDNEVEKICSMSIELADKIFEEEQLFKTKYS